MPELACINGTFSPIDEARVPIEDRGYQFADGVYEVIVFYGRQGVMLEEHIQRLHNSCRGIHLEVDFENINLVPLVHTGVERAGFDQTMVYIQVTRGEAPRQHVFPAHCTPNLVMTFKAKPTVAQDKRLRGVHVMSVPDFRWSRCNIKSIALLPNVLARNEALALGFDDALFIGEQGEVHEASASNAFVIHGGHLLTPPQDNTILPGITRRLVLQCASELDIAVHERPVLLDDLLQAEEVFLSSTTIEVLPVTQVDHKPIGNGKPGPKTQALYNHMMAQFGTCSPT